MCVYRYLVRLSFLKQLEDYDLSKQFSSSIRFLALLFLGISLFSLTIFSILTLRFSTVIIRFPFQKEIIGSIFIIICLLGISLGVFPSKCLGIFHFRTSNVVSRKKEQNVLKMTGGKFSGHHPTCHHFKSHVLQIKDKTFCAGCTGLVIGAIFSFFGSLLYFFFDFYVEYDVFVYSLGFFGVFCGLLQYCIPKMDSIKIHFFLNVTFVLGAFLLLIGVDKITNSFFLELYLLIIILFWIITRIMLSQFGHKRICTICDLKKCTYL